MIAAVAAGLVLIMYAAVAGFSVVWLVQSGEMASIKPASWVAKALYWHGVFILGSLMLLTPVGVFIVFGWLLMGGRCGLVP